MTKLFRFFLISFVAGLLAACSTPVAYHGQNAGDILQAKSAAEFSQIDPSDAILGDANAPLTVFIYSSFTCPHCADLQAHIVPQLRRDFVSKGQINIVYRDFPIDRIAAQVSNVAQCIVDDGAYYRFVTDAFATQRQWAASSNPMGQIATIAQPFGLSAAQVEACANNSEISAFVQARTRLAGSLLGIRGTPSVFLGSQRLPRDYAAMAAQIRASL